MREEGLVCGGPERTCCLALFQGQGCSTQPARQKRKEGRKEGGVAQREHVPVAREGRLLEREGSSGPWGEQLSLSWRHTWAPGPPPCPSLSLFLASSVA